MRAWTVHYSGLAERPSRTVTGDLVISAETIETAARRAVVEIRRRNAGTHRRPASLDRLSLIVTRGGTVDRATADRIDAAVAV